MNTQSKFLLGTSLVVASTLFAVGCAKPKPQAAKTTLSATKGGGAAGSGSYDPNLNGIEGMYSAYVSNPDGVSQLEMQEFVTERYKGLINPDMITFLYDDPAVVGKGQRLKLHDIQERIPTLAWAAQGKPIAPADLDANLLKSFPGASRAARDGVIALIERYDEKWAGGDADKKLSQNELLVAGALMGLVRREDFSKGMPQRMITAKVDPQQIARKVNQQLYGRYAVSDSTALPSDDMKLEWVQLFLRFYLTHDQFKAAKATEESKADLTAFLAVWGIQAQAADADKWANLVRLYGQKAFFLGTGKANGKLGVNEAFNLLTDVLFAKAVSDSLEGDFTQSGAAKHPDKFASLIAQYPRTGKSVLSDAFWKSQSEGSPDLTSLTVTLQVLAINEAIFAGFNAGKDQLLKKSEATAALTHYGVAVPATFSLFYPSDATTHTPLEIFQLLFGQINAKI